jgi:hypothetical protein
MPGQVPDTWLKERERRQKKWLRLNIDDLPKWIRCFLDATFKGKVPEKYPWALFKKAQDAKPFVRLVVSTPLNKYVVSSGNQTWLAVKSPN